MNASSNLLAPSVGSSGDGRTRSSPWNDVHKQGAVPAKPQQQRAGRVVVRPVSRVLIQIPQDAAGDAFGSVVNTALRWMQAKAGRPLPDAAWRRQAFDLAEVGAQRAQAVVLDEPRWWSGRLDDADKRVALRTWVTEVTVAEPDENTLLFGARLTMTARGFDAPYVRTVPSFVSDVALACGARLDSQPITKIPKLVASKEDVSLLVKLLLSPHRRSDAVVLSLPENSEDPRDAVISPMQLNKQVMCVSHVFVLTGSASYCLSDMIGKQNSVYLGGVRIYGPGFNPKTSNSRTHPLILARDVASWENGGAAAFSPWLVNELLDRSARDADSDDRVPSFQQVSDAAQRIAQDDAKAAGASDAELLRLARQMISRLEGDLAESVEQSDGQITALRMQLAEAESARVQAERAAASAMQAMSSMSMSQRVPPGSAGGDSAAGFVAEQAVREWDEDDGIEVDESSSIAQELLSAEFNPDSVHRFRRSVWGTLRRSLRSLPEEAPEGVTVLELSGVTIRCAASHAESVFALSMSSQVATGNWEVFVVPSGDGRLRAGWRRRWSEIRTAPEPWQHGMKALRIAGPATSKHEPDFLLLACSLSASVPVQFTHHDLERRIQLAADLKHWKAVASQNGNELASLRRAGLGRGDPNVSAIPPRVWGYRDIEEWSRLNADRIVILPRAISACSRSIYDNPQLVFDSLDMLADIYPRVKKSDLPRQALKERATELGLKLGGSISKPGTQGSEYFVQYGNGKRLLDQHIGRGGSRDPRFTMRIYYVYDEELEVCVVGWMTTHLDTEAT